jgi:hypothetical protein
VSFDSTVAAKGHFFRRKNEGYEETLIGLRRDDAPAGERPRVKSSFD